MGLDTCNCGPQLSGVKGVIIMTFMHNKYGTYGVFFTPLVLKMEVY